MNENDLRRALGHLQKGDWHAAHEIVQADEESALACWAHGIVHLLEGDAANARYWYRRAGREFRGELSATGEIEALSAALRK